MIAAIPAVRIGALENRRFLRRAVNHLAGEVGIQQFLDVGTDIPTSPNVHEIAQGLAPDARVSTSTTTRSCWPTPGRGLPPA